MPLPAAFAPILARLRRLALVGQLAREAGWRHLAALAVFTGLSSLLDIAGLGVGVSLLLGAAPGGPSAPTLLFPFRPSLQQGLTLLVGLMLLRGLNLKFGEKISFSNCMLAKDILFYCGLISF